jgi:hypothetical protein
VAAGNTYVAIATQTLGSATASVTFSSISGSYTDLVLVVSGQFTATGNQYVAVQVGNGSVDTGNNYSDTQLIGTGTSAISGRDSNLSGVLLATFASTSSSIGTAIFNLMNYSNTTTYKTILGRGSDTNGWSIAGVGLWRSTSAINTIKVYVTGTTFVTGSTFSLYGIAAA